LKTSKEVEKLPQKRKRKKKEDGDEELSFEAGRVFSPKKAKEEDLEEDLDSATYKARKGEGGDRKA
jgi:hypothetical protein